MLRFKLTPEQYAEIEDAKRSISIDLCSPSHFSMWTSPSSQNRPNSDTLTKEKVGENKETVGLRK